MNSIPLEVGSAFHDIVAYTLQNNVNEEQLLEKLEETIDNYKDRLEEHKYQADVEEGANLIETLVALWCFHPNGYELFHERYELIASEQEMKISIVTDDGDTVAINCRPDAVVKDKRTGLYYTIDFKTAAMGDKSIVSSNQYDFQALTQPYAANQTLDLPIVGEIRWTFIKGKRMPLKDENGQTTGWFTDNYLLRPYAKIEKGELRLAYGSYWYCTESHKWKVKGGTCPGRKPHKHGMEWERIELVKLGSPTIFQWTKDVCQMSSNDGNYEDMLGLVRLTEPILFNHNKASSLITQIVSTTRKNHVHAEDIKNLMLNVDSIKACHNLDEHFPQNLDSCVIPYRCTFLELCHGSANLGNNLILNPELIVDTDYQPRIPNHEEDSTD